MSERKFTPDRQGGRYLNLSAEMDSMRRQMEMNNPLIVLTVLQRHPGADHTKDYASLLAPVIHPIYPTSCTAAERERATRDGALLGLALCQGALSSVEKPVKNILQVMFESHIVNGKTEGEASRDTAHHLDAACERGMALFDEEQRREIEGWMGQVIGNPELTPYWQAGLGGVVCAANTMLKVIDDMRMEIEASSSPSDADWDGLVAFCEGKN